MKSLVLPISIVLLMHPSDSLNGNNSGRIKSVLALIMGRSVWSVGWSNLNLRKNIWQPSVAVSEPQDINL
jgi:hypothetical protein